MYWLGHKYRRWGYKARSGGVILHAAASVITIELYDITRIPAQAGIAVHVL